METTTTDLRQTEVETEAGHIPNQETIDAIRDLEAGVGVHTFHDLESLFKWLDDDEDD